MPEICQISALTLPPENVGHGSKAARRSALSDTSTRASSEGKHVLPLAWSDSSWISDDLRNQACQHPGDMF
jgi:hypothetical protein